MQKPITAALALSSAICLLNLRAAAGSPAVEQVIVVFKTHFDIGYTDFASNVVQRYRTTMIDQALAVVDQNRGLPPAQQFVWTVPGWPMSKIAADWPGQTAARQLRIQAALKEGRFAVHALPFSTHTELLEMEDLVRGLGYASRLSSAVGLELPRDAKMTDVPCHSWFLPTLLRHSGVDFLHLGCNAASTSPTVPMLFWWQGPDGSRLLTMYSAGGYGTGLKPPSDWPHKTWLALIHTGDNHGPPTPEEVKQLMADAAAQLPGVRMRIGRLSDFADALLAEHPDLPVVRGDMPDTWIHGPMCDPAGARIARNTRPLIPVVEALDTELQAWGVAVPGIAEVVPRAAENSLLYGEHTWGGALYWVTQYSAGKRLPYGKEWNETRAAGKYARLEASWDEHTAYIKRVEELIQPALAGELSALAQSVSVTGPRIVVFNPLPWPRDGLVSLPLAGIEASAVMATDGQEVQPLERHGQLGTFVAPRIPPMGYRTFLPVKAKLAPRPLSANSQSVTIESPFFRASFDLERGLIRSLIAKRSGRELVDTSAPHGLGQYLYERFDSDAIQSFVKAYVKLNADWATNELGKPNLPPSSETHYAAYSPAGFQWRSEVGPVSVSAFLTAAARDSLPAVTTKLTLYCDLPYADLELTVHEKPADPWPEAGWLCLPFKVTKPQFRLGRLGSIVDPARDLVAGANHRLLALNTGLGLTDPQGAGAGCCALDDPLVSLEEPGCWKYSPDFVPRRPWLYVNLFNNQWTTNFRLWNSGTWTARVRIWSIESYDHAGALLRPSWEARLPLLGAEGSGIGGKLPPTQGGVEVANPGVILTAFGPNPDGPGLVLRLWEQAGGAGECLVRLPEAFSTAHVQPINLRGVSTGAPIAVKNHRLAVPIQPFAPVSLQLEPR